MEGLLWAPEVLDKVQGSVYTKPANRLRAQRTQRRPLAAKLSRTSDQNAAAHLNSFQPLQEPLKNHASFCLKLFSKLWKHVITQPPSCSVQKSRRLRSKRVVVVAVRRAPEQDDLSIRNAYRRGWSLQAATSKTAKAVAQVHTNKCFIQHSLTTFTQCF